MDFKQFEYFRAVVEAGSVSQAAKNLGMTQPPISMSIAKLEGELGVQLLERTSKGVVPTAAGIHLLTKSVHLLHGRDRLLETLTLMGQGMAGSLRVGAEPMVISELFADVLSDFLDEVPDAQVSLSDVSPDEIVKSLAHGDLDLACVPFGPELWSEQALALCDHLLVTKLEVNLAVPLYRLREDHLDGRGWGRWILPLPLESFSGFPEAARRALVDDDQFSVIEVSTPQTALAFVTAGLGVSPATSRMAENHRGIAMVPAPDWLPQMHATLMWRKDADISPMMRHWISATERVAAGPT